MTDVIGVAQAKLDQLARQVTATANGQHVGVGPLPPPLSIPTVKFTTYTVDTVSKDVRFSDHGWPAASQPVTSQAPVGGRLLLTGETVTRIGGSITRTEVRVPQPAVIELPVTATITWGVYKDAAATEPAASARLSATEGVSTYVSATSVVQELVRDQPVPSQDFYVNARVKLSVSVPDPLGGSATTIAAHHVTPTVPVKVPGIGIPSLLALFDSGGFSGDMLIVLPRNSPLVTVQQLPGMTVHIPPNRSGLTQTLSALSVVLRAASLPSPLDQAADHLDIVTRGMGAAPNVRFAVADRISDLYDIVMRVESNVVGIPYDVEAHDMFGSLVLASGNPAKGVRLYNRSGFVETSDATHNGGAFTVRAGEARVSAISNLGVQSPSSSPRPTVENVRAPSGTVTFTNQLSSLEWL